MGDIVNFKELQQTSFDQDAFDERFAKRFNELKALENFTMKDVMLVCAESFMAATPMRDAEDIVFNTSESDIDEDALGDIVMNFLTDHQEVMMQLFSNLLIPE